MLFGKGTRSRFVRWKKDSVRRNSRTQEGKLVERDFEAGGEKMGSGPSKEVWRGKAMCLPFGGTEVLEEVG